MSAGCGTLCSPSGFRKGTAAASISNGKQHTLPKNPVHRSRRDVESDAIETHWGIDQPKGPTRLWGSTKSTSFGGVHHEEGPELWLKGEFWNCDSNIRIWGPHEVRRNAASQNHDVHRHDQVKRIVLPPQPGARHQQSRQCVSGVVGADSCFLEAWGFDLGLRDRQARPTSLWKPVDKGQIFRAERSYTRDIKRLTDNFRTLRTSASEPGKTMPSGVVTLRPEDIGGEAGEASTSEDFMLDRMGRTHGARSCHFHDTFDHAVRREAAKMACAIHSPSYKAHSQDYHIKENLELQPAHVYTLKHKKAVHLHGSADSLRRHVTASEQCGRTTARAAAKRTGFKSTLTL